MKTTKAAEIDNLIRKFRFRLNTCITRQLSQGYPAPKALTSITDAWIKENKYLLLKIPSAQSELDFNFLINPNHPDHSLLKIIKIITPQKFDKRLKGENPNQGSGRQTR
jgi:hypothetical protein